MVAETRVIALSEFFFFFSTSAPSEAGLHGQFRTAGSLNKPK